MNNKQNHLKKSMHSILENLRQHGEVRISHFRFHNEDVKLIRKYIPDYDSKKQVRFAHDAGIQPFAKTYFSQEYGAQNISPLGGRTEIVLTDRDGNQYFGYSDCSFVDNFNRYEGVIKAAGRVFSAISHGEKFQTMLD